MRYVKQFCIIVGFSLLGELMHWLLPLPVPAAIYGLCMLFLALKLKLLKTEAIKETANFLILLLPLFFIAPTVNLIDYWPLLVDNAVPILTIIVVSTLLTFGVSGLVTQLILKRREGGGS